MSVSPVRTRPGLVLATAALTGALALGAPLAASAHVHVDPQTAEAGAKHADLSFSVPNESATETTTAVSIALPEGAGLSHVEPGKVPGWTSKVVEADGRATHVDWTTGGDGIGEGESVDFPVEVGPVPDTGSIEFSVAQTYSDGTVVKWDDATPASGEEPANPAPTLYINDTPPVDHDESATAASGTTAVVADGSADAALVLAGSALAVSVAAVVLALLALLRATRKPRA